MQIGNNLLIFLSKDLIFYTFQMHFEIQKKIHMSLLRYTVCLCVCVLYHNTTAYAVSMFALICSTPLMFTGIKYIQSKRTDISTTTAHHTTYWHHFQFFSCYSLTKTLNRSSRGKNNTIFSYKIKHTIFVVVEEEIEERNKILCSSDLFPVKQFFSFFQIEFMYCSFCAVLVFRPVFLI